MKNLNGLISGMVACTVLGAFSAHGQSLAVSLAGTYSGGTAYAYAETTSDYATGYYYDLCTYIGAFGEEDDGTWDFYETSGNCSSTDAEQSWTFTPTGTTDFISFFGQHVEYVDYLVDQMDEYCGFDPYECGYYWDAYEMSLVGDDYPGDSGAWVLWGPPAFGLPVDQIAEYTEQDVGTDCPFPDSESSSYAGSTVDGGYDVALFYATLIGAFGDDYSGRVVQEAVEISSETCNQTFGGGPNRYTPVTSETIDSGTSWDVDSNNQYGNDPDLYDEVGDGQAKLLWYQGQLAGSSTCWDFQGTQQMSINRCAAPTIFDDYTAGGLPNTINLLIKVTDMVATRGDDSGSAQH